MSLYASALLQSFSSKVSTHPDADPPAILFDPLSQQELRVLRLVSRGLPIAEIARELVVSRNTVKTQIQSIYRKMNVHSREEARQIARELNLL